LLDADSLAGENPTEIDLLVIEANAAAGGDSGCLVVKWIVEVFLTKRLRNVAAEMALHVLAYNLTRVMNILGKPSLIAAIRAA
jgi:hypothetical protein